MIKVADALNSFASEPEATAPPSEEIFVLSGSQLGAIISQAIERATAPLEARLDALEEGVGPGKGEEPQASQHIDDERSPLSGHISKISSAQVFQDLREELWTFQEITAKERAADRRRIAALEIPAHEITETERDRLERIEKYLRDAPNHTMSLAELRGRLGIGKQRLSMLIKKLDPEIYSLKKSSHDKRVRYLCLQPVLK